MSQRTAPLPSMARRSGMKRTAKPGTTSGLGLRRETVRMLSASQLPHVAGGIGGGSAVSERVVAFCHSVVLPGEP
jgi:hypothetical protein